MIITTLILFILLVVTIFVCKEATKLNPVYAMLMAALTGASAYAAIKHLFENQPILFLIWAIYALINTTTVARWLAAHAAEFIER